MERVRVSERDQHLKSQLIIIIIIIITFMQDIYNYIPETSHISGIYNFASVLWIQFMFQVILYLQVCYIIIHVPEHVCSTQCGSFV
jgi:hypothetical protein